METRPMEIIIHNDIRIYIEYYEDHKFSDIIESADVYFAESHFFWTMIGAINFIIEHTTAGNYIIYKCKNGVFCDNEMQQIN